MKNIVHTIPLLALCISASAAQAGVLRCEIGGERVNPNNGSTTAGKTGLMRCRDGENGPLQREQEIKNGVFMGLVRFYDSNGDKTSEHHVNQRGNREGLARTYEGGKLVLEETMSNGDRVGLSHRWHKGEGKAALKRAAFHSEGRELAMAEFTPQGKLSDLRCGAKPLLGPDVDDAAWCGFKGRIGKAELHGSDGKVVARVEHERGERRRSERLWPNGKPSEVLEISPEGGSERVYADTGVLRREKRWVMREGQRVTTLQREHHESGTPVLERQWTPNARGAALALEQSWYLNGQVREKQVYSHADGKTTRLETKYRDNGRPSSEGLVLVVDRYTERAIGVHKSYDDTGRLRRESHYDERGRLARERVFDETGAVTRDDALFEDGSRKAFGVR